jgi:hypothetical protein
MGKSHQYRVNGHKNYHFQLAFQFVMVVNGKFTWQSQQLHINELQCFLVPN